MHYSETVGLYYARAGSQRCKPTVAEVMALNDDNYAVRACAECRRYLST